MAGCVVSTLRHKPSLSPVRAARQLVMLVASAASLFTPTPPPPQPPSHFRQSAPYSPTAKVPQLNLNSPTVVAPRKISVRGIAPYISPRSKQKGRSSRSNSNSSHSSMKIKSPVLRSRSPSGNSINFTFTNKSAHRSTRDELNTTDLSAVFAIQPKEMLMEFSELKARTTSASNQRVLQIRRKSHSMKTEQSGSASPSDESSSNTVSDHRPNSAPTPRCATNYEISAESYHANFSTLAKPEPLEISQYITNSRRNLYMDPILISAPNKSSPLFSQNYEHHNIKTEKSLDVPLSALPSIEPLKIRVKPKQEPFEIPRKISDDSPRAHSARETTARDLRRSKEITTLRKQESLNIHARKLRVDHLREMLNRERGLVDNLIVEFLY